jgi:Flp pilus assembly protein TadG
MSANFIRRRLKRCDGAEIAEAALVLPLVFTMLFGTIWFGRAFNIYSTIQQAAQQGAIKAARATCATCGAGATGFPAITTVTGAVETVMNASNVPPSAITATTPNPGLIACPTPPFPPPPQAGPCQKNDNIWVCTSVVLNPTGATLPVQCGVVVMFQYPFVFNFPGTSLNMQQILMTAQAQSRIEN